MNIRRRALAELHLWRKYRYDRLRWLFRERHGSLGRKTFRMGDVEYSYFVHPYNHTWANERAVEIPVVRPLMEAAEPSSTLEIGNVTSHYIDSDHTVVDKFERCLFRPVISKDIIDFNPKRQFELVVAISTFEHVGWDETPRDENRVLVALQKLRTLLTPGGKAIVTIPVGYNQFLDQRLPEIAAGDMSVQCLKRVSEDNQWVETDLEDALKHKYGEPFMCANALAFLYLVG